MNQKRRAAGLTDAFRIFQKFRCQPQVVTVEQTFSTDTDPDAVHPGVHTKSRMAVKFHQRSINRAQPSSLSFCQHRSLEWMLAAMFDGAGEAEQSMDVRSRRSPDFHHGRTAQSHRTRFIKRKDFHFAEIFKVQTTFEEHSLTTGTGDGRQQHGR